MSTPSHTHAAPTRARRATPLLVVRHFAATPDLERQVHALERLLGLPTSPHPLPGEPPTAAEAPAQAEGGAA